MVVGAVEGRTPLPQIFFGGAYSTPPDHLALFIGSTSKGREGKGEKTKWKGKRGRTGYGRVGEGRERILSITEFRICHYINGDGALQWRWCIVTTCQHKSNSYFTERDKPQYLRSVVTDACMFTAFALLLR